MGSSTSARETRPTALKCFRGARSCTCISFAFDRQWRVRMCGRRTSSRWVLTALHRLRCLLDPPVQDLLALPGRGRPLLAREEQALAECPSLFRRLQEPPCPAALRLQEQEA